MDFYIIVMFMFKNAISSIIALSLLLVVSILSVIIYSDWQTFFTNDFLVENNDKFKVSLDSIKIQSLIGDNLYVYSDSNIEIKSISINQLDCGLSGDVSGFEFFDVSGCLGAATSPVEVMVVTQKDIVVKTLNLE